MRSQSRVHPVTEAQKSSSALAQFNLLAKHPSSRLSSPTIHSDTLSAGGLIELPHLLALETNERENEEEEKKQKAPPAASIAHTREFRESGPRAMRRADNPTPAASGISETGSLGVNLSYF